MNIRDPQHIKNERTKEKWGFTLGKGCSIEKRKTCVGNGKENVIVGLGMGKGTGSYGMDTSTKVGKRSRKDLE